MAEFAILTAGDPAPSFHQRSTGNPRYAFDSAAGRYIVLCIFATASDEAGRGALDAVLRHRHMFDDERAAFFGVSLDPADEAERRVAESLPGLRFFWDFDGKIAKLYGAVARDAAPESGPVRVRRLWFVLDPTLHVIAAVPFAPDGADCRLVFDILAAQPPVASFSGFEMSAPVIVLPRVFEPDLCAALIAGYERDGGTESGFMREVDGRTVTVHDPGHKRRRDWVIDVAALRARTQDRVHRRLVPEIRKVHHFAATRMERYIVSCYSAEDGGHFRPHRDNTTKGTAHRRFAVTVNLNEDYEGGELCFPEYGPRRYKTAPGGAIVFSCSLLHTVTPVTKGRRFAFLPFLYDDAAAKLREENAKFVEEGKDDYRA